MEYSTYNGEVLSEKSIRVGHHVGLRKFNYIHRLIVSIDKGKNYFVTFDPGFWGRSGMATPINVGDRVKLVFNKENGYIEFDEEKYKLISLTSFEGNQK